MSIAASILAKNDTIRKIRIACRQRCFTIAEGQLPGRKPFAAYYFSDASQIIIEGRAIKMGVVKLVETTAIDPRNRRCVSPDCWACSGSGIHDGKPCTWNDAIPF